MNPQSNSPTPPATTADTSSGGSVVLAWLVVGLPLAWGVSQTFIKALALFK
ncbi:MFS transporter small subunit [Hymenobacter properus]|uniref:Oxalate:formate antiporter n=1 Tax=Hymenobacter properus TaxID=2791026 RepID=A0A931BJM6_9BACT|nr:hypothetical protein [Hymenobacter properus]MBF9141453.1 hypothetical protein [Hymenobacter properus]MBR7720262.1 hypothetical protein [Microvirga sp. SRT04]